LNLKRKLATLKYKEVFFWGWEYVFFSDAFGEFKTVISKTERKVPWESSKLKTSALSGEKNFKILFFPIQLLEWLRCRAEWNVASVV
jgi:hypothetical protein